MAAQRYSKPPKASPKLCHSGADLTVDDGDSGAQRSGGRGDRRLDRYGDPSGTRAHSRHQRSPCRDRPRQADDVGSSEQHHIAEKFALSHDGFRRCNPGATIRRAGTMEIYRVFSRVRRDRDHEPDNGVAWLSRRVCRLEDKVHGRRKLTVADVGEQGLIARLQRALSRGHDRSVALSIGDDAALLRQVGPQAVLTTDMLLEGVDFERRWASARDIGHKAAAVNLSDLAAMGARPRGLLLSLAIAPTESVAFVIELARAADRLGQRYGAPVVGGDLSRTTGPLVVSVTAVGEVHGALALRRGRGRPGDLVLVSGTLGDAALGLALLQRDPHAQGSWVRRQLRPLPRVPLALALAAARVVRSAADISDGLARDARHVVAPGCGVYLTACDLPLAPGLVRRAARLGISSLDLALGGGEDFELVLAVAPANVARALRQAARLGEQLTVIGRIDRGRGVHLDGHHVDSGGARGFDHFK
mgnify:CR=1 FL=1